MDWLQLIYSVALVSDVQQSDSVIYAYVCVYIYMCVCVYIYIYIYIFFFWFFSNIGYNKILNIYSLCYTVGPFLFYLK